MSVVLLTYTGSEYTTPDHAAGYGTTIPSPATKLSDLVANSLYCVEAGADVDVVFVSGETFLVSCFKSYLLQKLLQQFVMRMTIIGGQEKLRLVHRNLATTFSLEQALRACGADIVVSDDCSDISILNTQLAPIYMQIYHSI